MSLVRVVAANWCFRTPLKVPQTDRLYAFFDARAAATFIQLNADPLRCTFIWSAGRNVRFGSLADICSAKGHVRFTPNSGHLQRTSPCLLCANSGHSVFTDQGAQPKSKRLQSASLANVTAA
jgi:hypothetical protein